MAALPYWPAASVVALAVVSVLPLVVIFSDQLFKVPESVPTSSFTSNDQLPFADWPLSADSSPSGLNVELNGALPPVIGLKENPSSSVVFVKLSSLLPTLENNSTRVPAGLMSVTRRSLS